MGLSLISKPNAFFPWLNERPITTLFLAKHIKVILNNPYSLKILKVIRRGILMDMKFHPIKSAKKAYKKLTHKNFTDKIGEDKLLDMAAALAFYTALSLAPLIVLLITFATFLGEDFRIELISQVKNLVGAQASQAINSIIENADENIDVRNTAGLLGFLTLLFSAGAIFGQLRASLDTIYSYNPDKEKNKKSSSMIGSAFALVKEKVFNMGMVLTFVFISIVSLVVSSVLNVALSGTAAILSQVLNFALSIVVFGGLFACIYYFLPHKKIPLKVAFATGLLTAFLFSVGKNYIGLYLGNSAVSSAYGAAGSLIVLLMWVFFSSLIIFACAEIMCELMIGPPKKDIKKVESSFNFSKARDNDSLSL